MPVDYGSYLIDPFKGFNQGLLNIGQALQYRREMERQRILDVENKRLRDLQVRESTLKLEELERQKRLRTGLETTLANLAPTEKPLEVAKKYFMQKGQFGEVINIISLDDKLAEYGAKVQAGGGSIEEFYRSQIAIDKMKKLGEVIKSYKGREELLKVMWPTIMKDYPEAKRVDLNSLERTKAGIVMNAKNPDGSTNPDVKYMYDNEGKIHIIQSKPKEFAPELKKFVKGKEEIYVDKNKPEDVKIAQSKGFTEYEKPEKPTESIGFKYWGTISKIEDDARAYANVVVPKAAGGISFLPGGGIKIGGGIEKEDVDKWIKAYQDHYSRKVEEAKKFGALPKEYISKPIIEGLPPRTISDIEEKGGIATGKIVPRIEKPKPEPEKPKPAPSLPSPPSFLIDPNKKREWGEVIPNVEGARTFIRDAKRSGKYTIEQIKNALTRNNVNPDYFEEEWR